MAGDSSRPLYVEPALVCTIILAFGGTDELIQCLDSLRTQIGVQLQIVIVQNGAPESLLKRIAELYPEVHLIRNGANAGAATGRNIGLQVAARFRPNYVFFADNDATFAPNAIRELVGAAQANSRVGLFGAVVYCKSEHSKVLSAGAFLHPPFQDKHVLTVDFSKPTITVDFVGTGAMLVPWSVVERIGKFDDALVVHDEDTDWCMRGRKAGLKTMVVTSAVAYHDVPTGKFTPRHIYYAARNRLIVAQRHELFSSLRNKTVWSSICSRGFKMMLADDDVALTCTLAYWIAIWHYARRRLGKCPRWMNGTEDNFFEARLRRKLRKTAVWKMARRLRQLLFPS